MDTRYAVATNMAMPAWSRQVEGPSLCAPQRHQHNWTSFQSADIPWQETTCDANDSTRARRQYAGGRWSCEFSSASPATCCLSKQMDRQSRQRQTSTHRWTACKSSLSRFQPSGEKHRRKKKSRDQPVFNKDLLKRALHLLFSAWRNGRVRKSRIHTVKSRRVRRKLPPLPLKQCDECGQKCSSNE